MNIKSTKVFKINGVLFVADSLERAVSIFREKYPFPTEIERVVLITGDESNLAWTEEISTITDVDESVGFVPYLFDPVPTYELDCPPPPTIDDAPLTEEEIKDLNNYLDVHEI